MRIFETVLAGFCLLAGILMISRGQVAGGVGWLVACAAQLELASAKKDTAYRLRRRG